MHDRAETSCETFRVELGENEFWIENVEGRAGDGDLRDLAAGDVQAASAQVRRRAQLFGASEPKGDFVTLEQRLGV